MTYSVKDLALEFGLSRKYMDKVIRANGVEAAGTGGVTKPCKVYRREDVEPFVRRKEPRDAHAGRPRTGARASGEELEGTAHAESPEEPAFSDELEFSDEIEFSAEVEFSPEPVAACETPETAVPGIEPSPEPEFDLENADLASLETECARLQDVVRGLDGEVYPAAVREIFSRDWAETGYVPPWEAKASTEKGYRDLIRELAGAKAHKEGELLDRKLRAERREKERREEEERRLESDRFFEDKDAFIYIFGYYDVKPFEEWRASEHFDEDKAEFMRYYAASRKESAA
jgi:hypothetical protein